MVSMTGECFACGYAPVGYNAESCPKCATRIPNPGIGSRCIGRGAVIGMLSGALLGMAWGFVQGGVGGAIGGSLISALLGLLVGFIGGIIAGVSARLLGKA